MRTIDGFRLSPLLACCLGGCEGGTSTNKAPPASTLTPKIRAAMNLNGARKMEKLKQKKAALDAYRQISQEFPDSESALWSGNETRTIRGGKTLGHSQIRLVFA